MIRPSPQYGRVVAGSILASAGRSLVRCLGVGLCALSLLGLWGCRTATVVQPPETNDIHANQFRASAYYYFTRAQLMIKQGDLNEAAWLMDKAVTFDPESVYLRLALSRLYLDQKAYHKARTAVQWALDREPDNTQALTLSGRIYQQQNKTAEAKQAFEKALEQGAVDPDVYLYLGRLYWDANDMQNAGRVFASMVKAYPDSYAACYFNGMVLSAQGDDSAAEAAFQNALALEPSLDQAREELLKIYQKRNQNEKITQTYLDLIHSNPSNYDAILGLAEHYHRTGHQAEAETLLAGTGRTARDNDELFRAIYHHYFEPKDYQGGLWVLKAMLRGAPQNPDLHYWAARAYEGLSDNNRALAQLKDVFFPSKFYHIAVIERAVLLHDMGRIEDAVAVIKEALRHKPDHVDYFLYLGTFYEEMERYEEALKALQQGLALDNDNSRLHYRLGEIYDKLGHREKSIEAMKTVVRLKPDDAQALNYLGYTYADMGINLDEAETLIQRALEIKPDDGYITDSLGWLYYKRGRYKDALQYLHKASELVPGDPVILEHLGDVYRKLDQPQRAIVYYRRSIENKNKNAEVLKKRIEQLSQP